MGIEFKRMVIRIEILVSTRRYVYGPAVKGVRYQELNRSKMLHECEDDAATTARVVRRISKMYADE